MSKHVAGEIAANVVTPHSERILIVEDESLVAEEIRERLGRIGYLVVGVADTAAQAIELASATRPDLVLMDVRLKGSRNGIEAAEHLHEHLSIPSVFITAQSDRDMIQTAGHRYVLRPFEEGALETAVEAALERHRRDTQLTISQITQAAMLESASDAIISHDLDGIILSWNPAAERLFGYTAQDAIGRNVMFLIPDSNREELTITLESVRQGHAIEFQPAERLFNGGAIGEMWVKTSPIRGATGTVIGAVEIARDVSEQKRVERALRDSENRLRAIVQGMPVLLMALDERDIPLAWNSECERVSGYAAAEIIGNPHALEFLFPDANQRESMFRDLRNGNVRGQTWHLTGKEGSVHSIEWSCISGVLPIPGWARWCVGVDVTRRMKLEERVRQGQKFEGLGRLAAGVAHDFNNLLSVINGYGDLLLRKMPETAPERASVSSIRAAGRKAAELTSQLLAFGKHHVLKLQPLNLNELLEENRPILSRAAGDDIELMFETEPALGLCVADPSHIHQVLMNLVVNARDAIQSEGRIVIRTSNFKSTGSAEEALPESLSRECVLLSVIDSGAGIPPEIIDRIFDPFFTTKAGGTGLGLSIVYASVEQCGGAILVSSRAGQGTEFSIYLPRESA